MTSIDVTDVVVEKLETAREDERAYYVRFISKNGIPLDTVVIYKGGKVDELRVFFSGNKKIFKGREARKKIKPISGLLELFFLFAEEWYRKRMAMMGWDVPSGRRGED
jgi:hypothetical protein